MSKYLELNAADTDVLLATAKALSSPVRLDILNYVDHRSASIGEIAAALDIPQSTCAVHVNCLENANLINVETAPGSHGIKKICSRKKDTINIKLTSTDDNLDFSTSVSMPVGAFTDSEIYPTCGMCSATNILKCEDCPSEFYDPERFSAQLLWSSAGFVEYRFPLNEKYLGKIPKQLIFSFEACSEAPNYNESWKSDITIWINGVEALTFRSLGDYGARRGRLSPSWWNIGATQYGLLYTIDITSEGTFLNKELKNKLAMSDYGIDKHTSALTIRIGNKDDAEFRGGFNIFGKAFGDFEQDLILTLIYDNIDAVRK